ncbi:carbohydrate ABC transporter permease [Pseudanabaena mucicola]|uniref:Carbohydrate ABC transporter permease n=1 Tax=Pseudanabaena mucicola FACHB-723 TaxID=2692860 RepID=A0ABR8A185_9CYAN|nr:carbohydrate ABC transporter permease [Pseudanabaena mucicola]MBD2189117.1 carbohydrate ABC transporter permease [Pseudanabaena mucicola FACHB-723]
MKIKTKKSSINIWNNVPQFVLLIAIASLTVFPLLWLVSTAFKSSTENIFQSVPQLWPAQPTLDNFLKVWQNSRFDLYLWNSFFVSGITVILNLLFCSLAAFPLARMNFKGRDPIFWAIVGTTMIPFQITMIPLYILAVQLNLKNTYAGLIFPYVISAFGIFLLRQAFQSVPKDMEEAARMDGCSSLGIWWHVMIPAARPALITLAVFTFVAMWGDFLWPLVIVDKPELYTLPRGIASLASAFSEDWRLIAAGSTISILPVFIVFVFLQRYIIPTDASVGVKG